MKLILDTHCWLWWIAEPERFTGDALGLPLHHRDPFDRLLVSQAMAEEATLVTTDEQIQRYAINILVP